MDKEFLMRRHEEDLRRLQKHVDRGSMKYLRAASRDPTVRVHPVEPNISGTRINLIQLGLRYMEGLGLPAKNALEYAEAFGHEGKIAWRIEQYEQCVKEKWGDTVLDTSEFIRHMSQSGHRNVLDKVGYARIDGIRVDFERRVMLLRATCRAAELVDTDGDELEYWMRIFGKAGSCAFHIEGYKERQLSRRERTRH